MLNIATHTSRRKPRTKSPQGEGDLGGAVVLPALNPKSLHISNLDLQ